MNTVVSKPKEPKIITRVSNVENLLKSAKDLNTNSRKLRRLFEKNTYQKKTQLSVLKRYKRRLDSIEKADEERRRKASQRKIKLPPIKKFVGSFFAPGASNDPLKAIGALAAFKTASKLSKGDILGAIGPALVATGMVAGPSLVGLGVNKVFNRAPKVRRGFDVTGRRVNVGVQERYLSRYGDKAFEKRFGRDALKRTRQGTNVAEAVSGGGKIAKAFGRLGKSIIPGVGAVLGAVDAKMRADEGDITGSRISAASATLDTLTAASAATGIGLVATPFLGLASMTLDLINFARDITGMSENESKKKKTTQTRLEEQSKKQKESVNKKDQNKGTLSFATTLNGYERVVNKFQEFSKNFKSSSLDEDLQSAVNESARRIEDLGAGSTPISGPGYEFTQDPSFSQYLTGDVNAPAEAYDASHGTVNNYHDHFAFKDPETARRAAEFLRSKGITVTELKGVDAGVTGPHSGPGSAHHSGRAFDVPGYQHGGTPGSPIGEAEYRGSARVRGFMNDFMKQESERRNKKNTPTPQPASPAPPQTPPPPQTAPEPGGRSGLNNMILDKIYNMTLDEPASPSATVPKKISRKIEKYSDANPPFTVIISSQQQPSPPQTISQTITKYIPIGNTSKNELNSLNNIFFLSNC